MVERSDESLSIWELVDQHAIPIALTDEIAFGRCKEQCGAADLFCRESEGFGVTNIGVFPADLFAKFGVIRLILSFNSKLQQIYLGNGAIVRVVTKRPELVGRDGDPNDPGDLCDPSVPFAEDTFHGTHVAGTIGAAATNNASGVAGGAWNVKIVPVRALGKCGGRLSDINDAIRWAGGLIPAEDAEGNEIWNDNPADVINLSIGLFEYCPASLQDAIDSVTERGVLVVSAAGNARVATQYYAPGGCANVITVAAGDARGHIAPYSNFGPEVDLLAPGGDLTRDDNGDGRPDGVLSTKAATNCYDPVTGEAVEDCFYAFEQGTSMAAPHVSAALALLKARDPDATPEELKATLLAASSPRSAMQCSGSCALYPGTTPIEGSPDMCTRPCGQGLLDLAMVPERPTGGGGD
jgi:serine protease